MPFVPLADERKGDGERISGGREEEIERKERIEEERERERREKRETEKS
jgi:hypothetical protein